MSMQVQKTRTIRGVRIGSIYGPLSGKVGLWLRQDL